MPERGLIRWVGGKRRLAARIGPLIETHRRTTGGRLISLFAGSLAIERAVGGCALAADASPELLQLFADLQFYPPEVVHHAMVEYATARGFTAEAYRAGRAVTAEARASLTSSARFIYLCSLAFNGLWRVNSRGVMNVPPDPARLARGLDALPPVEAFQGFSREIRGIEFVIGWQKAAALVRPGDIMLVDSPYGAFDSYTADGFGAGDHARLATSLREMVSTRPDVGLIAFNAPEAAPIYHWAKCEEVTRSGCVSSKATERDPVTELVITAGLKP